MSNSVLFVSLLFLFYSSSWAQTTNDRDTSIQKIHIDKNQIEKYKQDPALNYTLEPTKPNLIERILLWIKKVFYKVLFKLFTLILSGKKAHIIIMNIIRALPYISILFFLYFTFKYLLGVDLLNWKDKKEYKSPKVFNNEEERIIKEEDIEWLIKQAIEEQDFRLATRFLYLNILKKLTEEGFIEWKPDKTNKDYIRELSQKTIKDLFKRLSLIYDYVWYGKYNFGDKDFYQLHAQYKDFLKQIKKV